MVMGVQPHHLDGSWSNLVVSRRQPQHYSMGPNTYSMGPNQDDGDELLEDFDLWLGIDGSCGVRMLGKTLPLRAGRAILIPPGVRVRQFTGPGQVLDMMYVHFDCLVCGQPVRNALPYVDAARLRLTLPGLPSLALVAEIDSAVITDRLFRIRKRPEDDLSQLMLSISLLEIIAHLREAYLGLASSIAEQRLERATGFLEQNLHRPISLLEVARHVHVSAETLGRLFRTHYRTSPIQYLTRLRMAKARELLQARQYNISEVSRACGYESLQYFSRAFSKQFGMPPGSFRKRLPLIP
jgi:AraC-like DNA-binding protein